MNIYRRNQKSMKKRNRIVISLLLTFIMLFAVLTGCVNNNPEGEKSEYTVTFEFNDGISRPLQKRVEKTKAIANAPSKPLATGYSFAEWFTALSGGEQITFPYTPTGDVTLYAHWNPGVYTVSFDNNYEGAPAANTENILYKQTVSKPATEPSRINHIFYDWFTAEEGGDIVSFPYTVKRNVTFYAHWIADTAVRYNVHFNLNYVDAPSVNSAEYIEGVKAVNAPSTPSRAGFAFKGWFESESGGTSIRFPYVPTEETTLYAQWAVAAYNLTLKNNYGAADASNHIVLAVAGDSETPEPTAPVRDGYTFKGWWTNARGGTKINFPQTFTRTATYYAHWEKDKVVANIFHAEYTQFNLTQMHQGYSGSVTGTAAIDADNGTLDTEIDRGYALSDLGVPEYLGYYVTYLYNNGDMLEFNIYSSKAASNVTLSARLAGEIKHFSIAPETNVANDTYAFSFIVNDVPLTYSPIKFDNYTLGPGSAGKFRDFTISTTVSLNAGLNTIILLTSNQTNYMGGTMYAVAPMIDYIKLTGTDAELSWNPIYENLGYIS